MVSISYNCSGLFHGGKIEFIGEAKPSRQFGSLGHRCLALPLPVSPSLLSTDPASYKEIIAPLFNRGVLRIDDMAVLATSFGNRCC